jgi:hypothetical protein
LSVAITATWKQISTIELILRLGPSAPHSNDFTWAGKCGSIGFERSSIHLRGVIAINVFLIESVRLAFQSHPRARLSLRALQALIPVQAVSSVLKIELDLPFGAWPFLLPGVDSAIGRAETRPGANSRGRLDLHTREEARKQLRGLRHKAQLTL